LYWGCILLSPNPLNIKPFDVFHPKIILTFSELAKVSWANKSVKKKILYKVLNFLPNMIYLLFFEIYHFYIDYTRIAKYFSSTFNKIV